MAMSKELNNEYFKANHLATIRTNFIKLKQMDLWPALYDQFLIDMMTTVVTGLLRDAEERRDRLAKEEGITL